MVSWITRHLGPIGVDLGSSSLKLLQMSADGNDIAESARAEIPATLPEDDAARTEALARLLQKAREGRGFRGREAVFCIRGQDLHVQSVRIAGGGQDEVARQVRTEAASRLPYPAEEAEIRFLEAADVRQGNLTRREVIVLVTRRSVIQHTIALAEAAGLIPVAIEVEPIAMLRSYCHQFRRDADADARVLFVALGSTRTTVVVARGAEAMFIKTLDVGGRQLDEAVARHLNLPLAEAGAMRRQVGDRRADQQDPEVMRTLTESIRPVLEQLANELALCLRYYSVTFRGQPIARAVLSGGEAHGLLAEWLTTRLELPCEIGNPLRSFRRAPASGRSTQWDIAAGLALRGIA